MPLTRVELLTFHLFIEKKRDNFKLIRQSQSLKHKLIRHLQIMGDKDLANSIHSILSIMYTNLIPLLIEHRSILVL